MAQSTWVVGTMGEPLLTHAPDERLWRLALGHVGPEWMLLAMEPDEPSLN
jgi:putative transcriptional regulator